MQREATDLYFGFLEDFPIGENRPNSGLIFDENPGFPDETFI